MRKLRKSKKINEVFKPIYKGTIEKLAPLINKMADKIPSRRERMLHIGLFGYSRGSGKVSLPRAIKFTSAFYTLGVPPEFIGTGRGLREIKKLGLTDTLRDLYLAFYEDLTHAGKYLNKENLDMLAKKYPPFKDVQEDIRLVEEYLGVEMGPFKPKHYLHRNFTSNIYYKMKMRKDFSSDLEEAAMIRKSLG